MRMALPFSGFGTWPPWSIISLPAFYFQWFPLLSRVGCPETHSVEKADDELRDLFTSIFRD